MAGETTTEITNRVGLIDELLGNRKNSTAIIALADLLKLMPGEVNGPIYATLAQLEVDLDHEQETVALVWYDDTVSDRGLYYKLGESGSGSWERYADMSLSAEMLARISDIADQFGDVQTAVAATDAALAEAQAQAGLAKVSATGAAAAQAGSETARDLSETYAGIVDKSTSLAGLTDPATLNEGDKGLVSGSGDDAIDGLYEVQSSAWVRVGDTGLTSKVNKADLPQLGVGQGGTGVPEILAAFTDENFRRTWLEVLSTTGGPSDYAMGLITAALMFENLSQAQRDQVRNISGVFDDQNIPEDIFAAFTDDFGRRTWLEVLAATGGPSDYGARLILNGLDFNKLTLSQIEDLEQALSVDSTPVPPPPATAPLPIALATAPQGVSREYPTLAKSDFNGDLTLSFLGSDSIYWPWIVDMSQDGVSGAGVALFWSTDHGLHSQSGTFMATAPGPEGPWTNHGMIFRDDVTGGLQHETPSVMWDEVNSRWLMYYQLQTVPGHPNQLTMVATAPSILDGSGTPVSWSVIGISATESYVNNAGDGHSGYFKPFRYDGGWYAHGLYGGTNGSRAVFWTSDDDGVTWTPSPWVVGFSQHTMKHLDGFDPENWVLRINSGAQIERNGQLWMICPAGPAAAGGVEIPTSPIVALRVQPDGVTFGRAVEITPPLQGWEDPLGVDQIGNALVWDGKVYVTYRQGGGEGGFGFMEVG